MIHTITVASSSLTDSSSIPAHPLQSKRDQWEDLIKLAGVRPRTAIRMAFRRVEETITEAARARNIEIADGALSCSTTKIDIGLKSRCFYRALLRKA
jgi:hypothetical protein